MALSSSSLHFTTNKCSKKPPPFPFPLKGLGVLASDSSIYRAGPENTEPALIPPEGTGGNKGGEKRGGERGMIKGKMKFSLLENILRSAQVGEFLCGCVGKGNPGFQTTSKHQSLRCLRARGCTKFQSIFCTKTTKKRKRKNSHPPEHNFSPHWNDSADNLRGGAEQPQPARCKGSRVPARPRKTQPTPRACWQNLCRTGVQG